MSKWYFKIKKLLFVGVILHSNSVWISGVGQNVRLIKTHSCKSPFQGLGTGYRILGLGVLQHQSESSVVLRQWRIRFSMSKGGKHHYLALILKRTFAWMSFNKSNILAKRISPWYPLSIILLPQFPTKKSKF